MTGAIWAPAPLSVSEIATASPWCQRWTRRAHSWRHISEGGFDPSRYCVEPISEADARAWIVEHHYSGSYPAASQRYGLFDRSGQMLGACVLGVPMAAAVLTNVFPDLCPVTESLDLSRLVLADQVPANAESWFIARVFAAAAERGVRGVVAFADPVPRQLRGSRAVPRAHRAHLRRLHRRVPGAQHRADDHRVARRRRLVGPVRAKGAGRGTRPRPRRAAARLPGRHPASSAR